jgi:hypothetical protein
MGCNACEGSAAVSTKEVPAMLHPGTMPRALSLVLLALAVTACGGGGGGDSNDGSSDSVPVLSNLQYTPDSVLQFEGDGQAAINGTFNFQDKGGDLASLTLSTSQGASLTAPISGAGGMKSGVINGVIEVDTSVIGRYTFEVYVTDSRGNRSNSLSGTFEVKVNDTGTRWSVQSLPVPSGSMVRLNGVVHSGSQYVAVGEGIFTSPDGVTWTERPTGLSQALNAVTWTGSRFVAVGNGGTVLTSTDGASWALQSVPAALEPVLKGVAASGSMYVAVGTQWSNATSTYAELILTSADGVTWNKAAQSYSMALYDVVWSGSKFVAAGTELGGTNALAAVLVSPDGVTWTKHLVGALSTVEEIAWSGSQFLATGNAGAVLSADGITWTQVGMGSVGGGAIGWSGQRFLVCSTVYCHSSMDGVRWDTTVQLPGIGPHVNGLAWGGTKWVAVGQASNAPLVLTSP